MNHIRRLASLAVVLSLNGCFFIYIPGSVIGGIGDAVTGAEGKHCVSRVAKIGERIRLSDGTVGTIKSLSGESGRCQDANIPIRALLTF